MIQVHSQSRLGNFISPTHAEGPVARAIEEQTAKVPSDIFLWAAGAAMVGALALRVAGRKHDALFVGQWAPTFLILGLYNKLVKIAGHEGEEIGKQPPRNRRELRGGL